MSPHDAEALLDCLPYAAMLFDFDARLRAMNEDAARLLGRPTAELIGRRLPACFPGNPEIVELDRAFLAEAADAQFARVVTTTVGEPATEVTLTLRTFGSQGTVLGLVTLREIEGDAATVRRLEEAVDRMRRVNAARHDINNLLMGLLGHVELLAESGELASSSAERLRLIREQAERIRVAVDALRTLSSRLGGS